MSHQKAGGAYYYQAAYNYFDDIIKNYRLNLVLLLAIIG